MHEERLYGTTNGDGDATINGPTVIGRLYAVRWIDGDLANGVDAVLSCVSEMAAHTLLTLTNADNDAVHYPRHLVQDESGAALTGTAGGDRALPVLTGMLKLVVSAGGGTKSGGCVVYWLD